MTTLILGICHLSYWSLWYPVDMQKVWFVITFESTAHIRVMVCMKT